LFFGGWRGGHPKYNSQMRRTPSLSVLSPRFFVSPW
jgi:hypothetical protein